MAGKGLSMISSMLAHLTERAKATKALSEWVQLLRLLLPWETVHRKHLERQFHQQRGVCGVRMWTTALVLFFYFTALPRNEGTSKEKIKTRKRDTWAWASVSLDTSSPQETTYFIFLIAVNKYLTRNKEAGGGCGRAVWGHSLSPRERLGSRGRGRWLHALHPGHAQLTFSFSVSFRS